MKKTLLIILLIGLSAISLTLGVSDTHLHIIMLSRIPRLVSVLLTGFGMSICGLIMQQISMNKFVSPTTGATLDSAKLGLLVSMIVAPAGSMMLRTLFAFAFAMGGTLIFMGILKQVKMKDSIYIPLVGLMLGNLIGALTSTLSYRFNLGQTVSSWLYGKFSLIVSGDYELIYLVIPLIILAFIYAKKLTLVGMGEDFTTNLGVNYQKIVNLGLVIVALISACIVLIAGTIPFVGLIVPNLVAIYGGDHMEKNIMTTGIVGALFLLVCDMVSRVLVYPYEIPIGLTVGIIGSGLFLVLLSRRRHDEG
ncbi:MAG: ABC transporter permease [Cellulosilyticaceae bacterium]